MKTNLAINTVSESGEGGAAFLEIDAKLDALAERKSDWLRTTPAERVAILAEIKEALLPVAQAWVVAAARHKGIAEGSPLVGEEWLSGPYTLMGYCNQMMATLARVEKKHHLKSIPLRTLPTGQIAARVLPHSVWDHLLLSGVKVDIWMTHGIDRSNLASNTASTYDPASPHHKQGGVGLVLGAGNIAAIAPLDVFHKLFVENEVVVLKMNPVNDYLIEFLEPTFAPLIKRGLLCIVRGGVDVGAYLCQHPQVDSIHITGAGASHDAIVWGTGQEGIANKAANTPKNYRRISSELGAVCPTIVVPGPWSKADIAFQAEQVATQKLHNSGFNCVACQVLVMPAQWPHKKDFIASLEGTIAAAEVRDLYYPGTEDRLASFSANNPQEKKIFRSGLAAVHIANFTSGGNKYDENAEVFAPALTITELDGDDAESFLEAAIDYANSNLYGTLGANIVIHPRSRAAIGEQRFEELIGKLRYGTIAINTWTGVGFLTPQATWGAFPGHSLADVQSGIGSVHNTLLFDKPERTVLEAPFRPFPRNLLSLSFSLLPRPPWFVTHRKGAILGKLLVDFQYRPSWFKLPRIFLNALLG